MAATQIESFCERCGTKYAFEQPGQRGRVLKGLGRTLGILGEDGAHESAGASRDPFHGVFRFCLECRQYTCPSCWNEQAGFCQGCVPLPESPDMGDFEAAAAMEAASHVHDALAELRTLGTVEAWPDADLPQPEHEDEAVPEIMAVAEPEPELVAELVAEPEPEPAAVVFASRAGVVVDTDELFAGPWHDFAGAAETTEEMAASEDWAALAPPPIESEPAMEILANEPEPVEVEAEASVEPEPDLKLVAGPELELELVAEPEALAFAESAPEPEVELVAEPELELFAEVETLTQAEPEPGPVIDLPVAARAEPEPELEIVIDAPVVTVPEPQPLAELPIAAMTPQLTPAPRIEPVITVVPRLTVAPPPSMAPSAAPASRLAALFGRGRKPAEEPAPIARQEPGLASGWRVTAPDETVWPPHAPVYEPPTGKPAAAPSRPSLLGPRPASGHTAGAPSGIRPCYQCALPLSATARFCRRCGTPQQPGA